MDDLIVTYTVSVVEDLATSGDDPDAFDATDFLEMMSAYLPETAGVITEAEVVAWVTPLSEEVRRGGQTGQSRLRDKASSNKYLMTMSLLRFQSPSQPWT